jgi:hypothetical protein
LGLLIGAECKPENAVSFAESIPARSGRGNVERRKHTDWTARFGDNEVRNAMTCH